MGKNLIPSVLCGCLVTGIITGWASVSWKGGGNRPHAAPAGHSRANNNARPTGKPWAADDFLAQMRRQVEASGNPGKPLLPVFADWTDAEILAALDESAAQPQPERPGQHPQLMMILLGEALRRDLEATLAWFAALSLEQRSVMAPLFGTYWPVERGREALDFLLANRDVVGPGVELQGKASAAAILGGAETFIAHLQRLARENLLPAQGGPFTYPPGFDYGRILALEDMSRPGWNHLKDSLLAQWEQQDRDAALGWRLENDAAKSFARYLQREPGKGDETYHWTGTRLHTLPAEQRAEILTAMASNWKGSLTAVQRLMEGAPDPAIRTEIRTHYSQGLFTGYSLDALAVIESTMPDTAERIRFLETIQPAHGSTQPLDRAVEVKMRETLRGWNVPDARIDGIVSRLHGLPKTPRGGR